MRHLAAAALVPQERPIIARSFNCGYADKKGKVPAGRPNLQPAARLAGPRFICAKRIRRGNLLRCAPLMVMNNRRYGLAA
jgi:hypothetical protein